MLELREVAASYGSVEAIRNVTLTVRAGTTVALLGRNGAGKTTTLRVISGVVRPRRGEVWFEGERLDGQRPDEIARRGVAHVPEGRHVFPGLSVMENLATGAYWRRFNRRDVRREAEKVLEYFPALIPHRRQPAGSLSGGEQQMVAIARALIARPSLIVADEPTASLDVTTTAEIVDLLRLTRQSGLAIALVSHDEALLAAVADRIVRIRDGLTAPGPGPRPGAAGYQGA